MTAAPPRADLAPRLLDFLRAHLGEPTLRYAVEPAHLPGGAFSAVSTFELAAAPPGWEGQLVLRVLPGDPIQPLVEAGMQDGARAAGLPSPRVLVAESSSEPLGAPFLVMELLPGRAFLRGVDPLRFAVDLPRLVRSWAACLATVLEELRAADPAPVLAAMQRNGVPADTTGTRRHLLRARATLADQPGLAAAVAWLEANEPAPPERAAIVHGDLWPANVLLRRGALSGLVDWTRGAVGDPALDVGFARVGFLLMPEPFPPPSPVRQLVHGIALKIAAGIDDRCTEAVGGVDRVRWYEALRCVVELADVVDGRRRGMQVGWEHGVPALADHLSALTGEAVSLHPAPHV